MSVSVKFNDKLISYESCKAIAIRAFCSCILVKETPVFGPFSSSVFIPTVYILSQSYNATRKWLDFCMNIRCRTIYLRYHKESLVHSE